MYFLLCARMIRGFAVGGGGGRVGMRLFSKKADKSQKPHKGDLDIGVVCTKNQQLYLDALNDPKVSLVVVIGSAGTGKTFIGCQWGIRQLFWGENVKRMVITRPLVPVSGEEIGLLPGGILAKMQPWTRPIYDAFLEKDMMRHRDIVDKHIAKGVIEMSPLAFMRGRTFSDSFIFADEMQNSTPEQMLMLLTRVGNGSKIVISGDLAQTDIRSGGGRINGLHDFVYKYKMSKGGDAEADNMVRIIEFEKGDVRRSKLTSLILDLYK